MRICITCGTEKPLDAFGVNNRYADGIHRSCKECERGRRRRYYQRNAEEERARYRKYCAENPDKRRDTRLRSLYGMSLDEYRARVRLQDGKCAVYACRKYCGESLHVDHCHTTKVNRGLLCGNCNRALGMLDEDPKRITALAEYAAQRCTGGDANEDHLRKSCTASP